MPIVDRVTIVGLGLIGGSLGMAARRTRVAREVVGLSRAASAVGRATRRGAIDRGTTDPRRAVRDADLVVLATPVDAIVPSAVRLARFMRPGSVLTDVGSTKAQMVQTLERRLPREIPFVGAHPLAGSERRGIEAADARLFDGAVCILTPTARTSRRATRVVAWLWRRLGTHVITMSPPDHDRLLAGTSHLAHLVAYALANSVASPPKCTPHSFLEMTRIARSDPELWDDIFLSNRTELLRAAARFDRQWRQLRTLLAGSRRAALRRVLADAKAKRDALRDS